jgi:lipopolysaccharide/colanic/teichoic acid biosynthesis glycosyltransferase
MEVRTLPIQIDSQWMGADIRPSKSDGRPFVASKMRRPGLLAVETVTVLPQHPWYLAFKTGLDRLVALLLFVPALPLIALAALLVRLTSNGPAFYTQARVGKNGKPFTIYKIRTMVNNCESLTGPRWAMPGDPRVTPLGWFLRVSHLDELPQLLNVMRGDMSLIGPRPERPEFIPELLRAFPSYAERLRVRPGVTGLAQVQLPADTDIASVRRKLSYDLYYVRRCSLWLDLRLLVCTAFKVFGMSYGTQRRLFRLPHPDQVEKVSRLPLEETRAPAVPSLQPV